MSRYEDFDATEMYQKYLHKISLAQLPISSIHHFYSSLTRPLCAVFGNDEFMTNIFLFAFSHVESI